MLVLVDDTFCRMEERIHALVSREFRRYAEHQVGIHHGQGREHGLEENPCLFLVLFIGDNGRHIHFRTRTSTGGNGHNRSSLLGRLLLAALGRNAVVPDVPVIGHHESNALGAVHDRTTAQRNSKVAAALFSQGSPVHHIVTGRIGTNLVEYFISYPSLIQFLFQSSQITVLFHAGAVAGAD